MSLQRDPLLIKDPNHKDFSWSISAFLARMRESDRKNREQAAYLGAPIRERNPATSHHGVNQVSSMSNFASFPHSHGVQHLSSKGAHRPRSGRPSSVSLTVPAPAGESSVRSGDGRKVVRPVPDSQNKPPRPPSRERVNGAKQRVGSSSKSHDPAVQTPPREQLSDTTRGVRPSPTSKNLPGSKREGPSEGASKWPSSRPWPTPAVHERAGPSHEGTAHGKIREECSATTSHRPKDAAAPRCEAGKTVAKSTIGGLKQHRMNSLGPKPTEQARAIKSQELKRKFEEPEPQNGKSSRNGQSRPHQRKGSSRRSAASSETKTAGSSQESSNLTGEHESLGPGPSRLSGYDSDDSLFDWLIF